MKHLIFILMLLATPVAAQQVPGLYHVTGVASDDVLNIRENPRASAAIVGELGPYANNVEVIGLSENGNWGQVNVNETTGWLSMAYLTLSDRLDGGSYLNKPLQCFGTEPFWDLNIRGGAATLTFMGEGAQEFDITFRGTPAGRANGAGMMIALWDQSRLTASVTPQQCGDGMSDRAFGLGIDLLLEKPDGMSVLQGCCQLVP